MEQPEIRLSIAWYRPEQWALLLSHSVDRDKLEDTHEEWLEGAKETFEDFKKQGRYVVKADVDVEALIDWCELMDCPLNDEARARFTTISGMDERNQLK